MNVLLPACGFGKRNPDHPVKELMVREGEPLIAFSFRHLLEPMALSAVNEILIITRKAKESLLKQWLENFATVNDTTGALLRKVHFLLYEPAPGEEWPKTLLASRHHWKCQNMVLLPDTKVAAKGPLVAEMARGLSVFKTHWGVIEKTRDQVKSFGSVILGAEPGHARAIIEKPQDPSSLLVWGTFGFRDSEGEALLQGLEKSTHSHEPYELPETSGFFELTQFTDLSRAYATLNYAGPVKTLDT